MAFLSKVITKVFGSKSAKDLKKLNPYIDQINSAYSELSRLSDKELKERFNDIKTALFSEISNQKKELSTDKHISQEQIDDKLYKIERMMLIIQ